MGAARYQGCGCYVGPWQSINGLVQHSGAALRTVVRRSSSSAFPRGGLSSGVTVIRRNRGHRPPNRQRDREEERDHGARAPGQERPDGQPRRCENRYKKCDQMCHGHDRLPYLLRKIGYLGPVSKRKPQCGVCLARAGRSGGAGAHDSVAARECSPGSRQGCGSGVCALERRVDLVRSRSPLRREAVPTSSASSILSI